MVNRMDIENTTFNGIGKVNPYIPALNFVIECEQCEEELNGEHIVFEGDTYCDATCLVNKLISVGVVYKVE